MKPACKAAALAALLSLVPPPQDARAAATAAPSPAGDIRRDLVVDAVERVMPSVVNIGTLEIVERSDAFEQMFREFWGQHYPRRQPNTQYSLGSGVIIDEEGYVLTNLHVVQRASKVWVKLHDGTEYEAEPLVGNTRADVALLRLKAKPGQKFKALRFAKDDDLLLGETVLALGNPFGLGGSVSRGILSSKNRRPPIESETLQIADWLQTDAAVNPGSSGGPLVNLRGDLIGLNVAVHREGQGIGFAIPIKQVAQALSNTYIPEVTQGLWFGARLRSGPYPLHVTAVEPGSPAATAGLKEGDLIIQVNGRAPKDFMDGTRLLGAANRPEIKLTITRDRERQELSVRLLPLTEIVRQRLGVTVQEVTAETGAPFGFKPGDGLLIKSVESGSPAAKADLRPGDLITAVDREPVPDLFAASAGLAGKSRGDRVELGVVVRDPRSTRPRLTRGTVAVQVR